MLTLRKQTIALIILAATGAAQADQITWYTPAYARPGEVFEGSTSGGPKENWADFILYSRPTSKEYEVMSGGTKTIEFSFVVPDDPAQETLKIWWSDKSGVISSHEVPIVHPQEFDITGDAAIELTYEVDKLNGLAIFVPCCTIYSGLLTAFTVPVNPVKNGKGLPEAIEKPFAVLEPDNLTKTTSGLAIELNYGEPPAPGLVPVVMSYNKRISTWAPVVDADHDPTRKVIRVQCPNGGEFIIGWLPESEATAQ